jgi:signal transduction histidine kinase
MRKIIITTFLMCLTLLVQAQSKRIDSLKQVLAKKTEDSNRVKTLINLSGAYVYSKNDTSLALAREALALARKINFKRGEVLSIINITTVFNQLGNYSGSLELLFEALKVAEDIKNKVLESSVVSTLADTYFYSGDISRSIQYSYRAIQINKELGRLDAMNLAMGNLGDTYEKTDRLDSALILTKAVYDYKVKSAFPSQMGIVLSNLGNIYKKMNLPDSAMYFYKLSNSYLKDEGIEYALTESYRGMAELFMKKGLTDSSLYYAKQSFNIAQTNGLTEELMKASIFLADYYKSENNVDSAYAYLLLATAAKDSLYNQQKAHEIQSLSFGETIRQQQIEEEKERSKIQLRQNALLGSMATLLIVAFLLLRNNRQKQKANKLLQKQKDEIDTKAGELAVQKEILQQSYSNVELLGEIGRKITSSLSIETIISTVYDHVNDLMDASVFGIGIYHDDVKQIEFPATYEHGIALPAYSNSIDDQKRFSALCFTSGEEIVMGDLQNEYHNYLQQVPVPMQGKQPVSLIYLPLKVKDKILGVITVQSFEKNAYSDYHLYMLRTIAIYAAIALENAESYIKLNQTVESLQNTQRQLIQSEKMASLGELTAGIAHEIQNPLNFVNNFSEVNEELMVELQDEVRAGNTADVLTLAIAINENLKKTIHHGRRADSIVKGMLQHSRIDGGKKELTDINALADEYLRLSYHGLRAKDKTFNSVLETHFDPSIKPVNIVQQEIGRVLLNLLNNAFYAVHEKKKTSDSNYEPTVSVSTVVNDDHISIKVKDNGNGIPKKVMDKIFQPFFTTKPTGEGTGLGLSLSYDIIKAHRGELKVDTKENEGAEFIISIPIN